MIQYIDFFSVVIASVFGFSIFLLWSSLPIFGKFLKKISWKNAIGVFCLLIFSSTILALAEQFFYVTSFWDGIVLGILLYIGILLPFSLLAKISRKDFFWKHFCVEQIAFFLILSLMSGILAG